MAEALRVALVINDASRSAGDAADFIRKHLSRRAEVVELRSSEPEETVLEVARVRSEVDRVIAAGGDGTLHYAALSLVGTSTSLGVLPLGTANDFARSVGLPLELESALEVVLGERAAVVNVSTVNDVPFLNVAGIGVVEEITESLSAGQKKTLGPLAYVQAAATTCLAAEPFPARITIDGVVESLDMLQVLIGNGRYFGPGIEVTPDARIDDGLLHICIIDPRSPAELVAAAIHLMRGHHERAAAIELRTGREVVVETAEPRAVYADGEEVHTTPAVMRIHPRGLSVLIP